MLSPPRLASLLLACTVIAQAAPRVPAADDEVVETLPARRGDAARLKALRARPQDANAAAELARHYYGQAVADGDPRPIGHAQAALAPWWDAPAPPPSVRVMRAVLLQWGHRFDDAVADLAAVVRADPGAAEAWAWLAAIAMVQARYDDARRACAGAAPYTGALLATACTAYVDSMTGRAAAAAAAIRGALQAQPQAAAEERLWALTRLAEIEERRGLPDAAEAAFREALSVGIADNYLRAAHADFLLDRGRAAEVLALLADDARSDTLLLRLALAAKAANAPSLAAYARDLAARFDAARQRGDTTHQKEEARFALAVQGDARRALALARENFAVQREAADARVLLEAALAARDPAAAEPALRWMADSGVESAALQSLAQRLREPK